MFKVTLNFMVISSPPWTVGDSIGKQITNKQKNEDLAGLVPESERSKSDEPTKDRGSVLCHPGGRKAAVVTIRVSGSFLPVVTLVEYQFVQFATQ